MAKKLPLPAVMLNLSIGHWIASLVYVAAKLKIADLLERGPRSPEDLAQATGVQAPELYRVLRALASVGVFAETKGGRFKLTPLAATLQTGRPDSLHGFALMANERYNWEAFEALFDGVETGDIPFVRAHGLPLFEYLQEHPEERKRYGEAMTSLSGTENPAVAAAYRFAGLRTLVDVGGGHGSLLATILKASPKLKGVLFDLPSVIARARQDRHITAKGIAERCSVEGGSFLEAVPKGGDAYIMKYILHDWDDDTSVKILANCRAAMGEKAKVLVVDNVIPPGNDPFWGKLLDIRMLVIGGRERTKKEFGELFGRAGLRLTRIVRTKCPLSIVEGVRA